MGRHLHIDPLGGAAGDMLVAALLAALPGLAPRALADAAAVLPAGLAPDLADVTASGIAAKRLTLTGCAERAPVTYADMMARIAGASLSPGTAVRAAAILTRLGEAEAAIHRVPLERVHFHEIADWDTLLDAVAAGSIRAALEDATVSVAPLPLGGGTIETAHGRLPVPAPATARILRGFQFHDDGVPGERVTPTGGAILAELTGGDNGARPPGVLVGDGSGAGTRQLLGVANIVRVLVFEAAPATSEALTLLAFDIDDMTGEEIAVSADRLRLAPGVRDVVLLQAAGKKGRPVTRFEVQALPQDADRVAEAVFAETSTLGLRRLTVRRDLLPRSATAAGDWPVKQADRPGGSTRKVESDALGDIATLRARRRARDEAEA